MLNIQYKVGDLLLCRYKEHENLYLVLDINESTLYTNRYNVRVYRLYYFNYKDPTQKVGTIDHPYEMLSSIGITKYFKIINL